MMRKGIDPPHIVALTIVVCAAIAPAFMLWGRTIGEWAVGIAVYTLITAVVLSLLVLDFVIVRYGSSSCPYGFPHRSGKSVWRYCLSKRIRIIPHSRSALVYSQALFFLS